MKSKFDLIYEAMMSKWGRNSQQYSPYTIWKAVKEVTHDFVDEWVSNDDAAARGVPATGGLVLAKAKELKAKIAKGDSETEEDFKKSIKEEEAAARSYNGYWQFMRKNGRLTNFTSINADVGASWAYHFIDTRFINPQFSTVSGDQVGKVAWGMWKAAHSAIVRKASNVEQMASVELPFKVGDVVTLSLKIASVSQVDVGGWKHHYYKIGSIRGQCVEHPEVNLQVATTTAAFDGSTDKIQGYPEWRKADYYHVTDTDHGFQLDDVVEVTGTVSNIKAESKTVYINRVKSYKFVSFSTKHEDDEKAKQNTEALKTAVKFWRRSIRRFYSKDMNTATSKPFSIEDLRSLIKDETNSEDGILYPIKDDLLKLEPNLEKLTDDAFLNAQWSEEFDPLLLKYKVD